LAHKPKKKKAKKAEAPVVAAAPESAAPAALNPKSLPLNMPKQVAVSADLVSAEIGPNSFEPDVELAHVVGTTWWKGQSGVQQNLNSPLYSDF
jgi:hypothetical protein